MNYTSDYVESEVRENAAENNEMIERVKKREGDEQMQVCSVQESHTLILKSYVKVAKAAFKFSNQAKYI